MTRYRMTVLLFSAMVGVLALLAAILFTVAGAGIFGTPFQGDAYFNTTLLFVLLSGPCVVLPCVLFDWMKPTIGGLLLCTFSLIEVVAVALNNTREWGFAMHDAALASLIIALPMFAIGTLLFYSHSSTSATLRRIWQTEAGVAMLVAGFFCWNVGADGISSLIALLQGGTI